MASTARKLQRLAPDERIGEIMREARRELALRGHERFSTADVAARVGVSEATVYRYFPTRRDLLVRVAEAWFGEILSVAPEVERAHDVYQQLRLVIRHSLDVIRKEPSLTRFVLLEMRTQPDYRSTRIYALNHRFTETVMRVLERGKAEGTLRADVAPRLVRDMIFGCIDHQAWSYLRDGREFSVEETADGIARLVLHGLVVEKPVGHAALARLEADAERLRADVAALRRATPARGGRGTRRSRR